MLWGLVSSVLDLHVQLLCMTPDSLSIMQFFNGLFSLFELRLERLDARTLLGESDMQFARPESIVQ